VLGREAAVGQGRTALATAADAVVVGGGMIGASAPCHLSALGLRRVILRERRGRAALPCAGQVVDRL